METKVIIMGGIGNGTVIAQAILDANRRGFNDLKMAGYFDDRVPIGDDMEGFPCLATCTKENVEKFAAQGYKFIYTMYIIDGNEERIEKFNNLGLDASNLATFVHPLAYVAPDVQIDPGVVIMPYAMISAAAHLSTGSIIMTGATVGHNTTLGPNNHIASQAVVGAYIETGAGVHVGLNCCIREHVNIGAFSSVGMGAVLVKNVGEKEIWVGNPAKFLRNAK